MNLISSKNLEGITPSKLPPPHREEGRCRLLCIGLPLLGLRSFNVELERYCARRDDIAAVHVTCVNTLPVKLLMRVSPLPGCSDFKVYRAGQIWRRIMRSWFKPTGPLPLDRFDAAIVCPQHLSLALADYKAAGGQLALAVHIDATVRNLVRDFGDSPITTRPLKWIDRHVFSHADLVTSMGSWAQRSVQADYGLPAERTMVIPPVASVITQRQETPRPGALTRIVFTGWDWVRKGGPGLLRWHQQHWADRAELHFIGGASAPSDCPNPKNVTFHGRVDRDRILHELLPSMDIFVLPTRREMSSWAAVEGMAAGLPVVITSIGGTPDLVEDGVTGFLVKEGDEAGFIRAISTLIDQPDRRRAMGEAARLRHQKQFVADAVYKRLIDRVKEVALAEPRLTRSRPGAEVPAA